MGLGDIICKLPQYTTECTLSADTFHFMLFLALRGDLIF